MAAKAIFVLCAQTLLVQVIYGQVIPCAGTIGSAIAADEYALAANALAYGGGCSGPRTYTYAATPAIANYGLAANSFVPSSGGGFVVQSISPIAPTGITVISENAIEGALAVTGELPFLSAVAVEGALPTAGAGGINYGCGDGVIGIVSEGISPALGPSYPAGVGFNPALAGGFGYGAGLNGRGYGGLGFGLGGCGCGGVY